MGAVAYTSAIKAGWCAQHSQTHRPPPQPEKFNISTHNGKTTCIQQMTISRYYLRTNLVTALASLEVNNLAHDADWFF
jgi:hypothetical protein